MLNLNEANTIKDMINSLDGCRLIWDNSPVMLITAEVMASQVSLYYVHVIMESSCWDICSIEEAGKFIFNRGMFFEQSFNYNKSIKFSYNSADKENSR